MELDFCDRCGTSIPRLDMERGAAARRGGRLLCAPCLAGARRRAAARSFLLPLAFLLAAAAGAAGAVVVLSPRLRAVETSVRDVAVRVSDEPSPPPDRGGEVEGLKALIRAQSEAIEDLAARLGENHEDAGAALARLADRIEALADEVRAVKERIREEAEAPPPPPPPAVPSVIPPPPAETKEPDLETWLPLLDDADPGVRLSALVAIEDSTDPAARKRARELLGDPDPLVRGQAAEMAGRWEDREAIPALLRLLSDANVRVRTVAHDAVAAMLGPVAGYDPTDPEDVREAAVRAFRESRK